VPRFRHRTSQWATSTLLVGLIVTFGVNCVPIAQMTGAPMVDCPMEAADHPCCVTDTERVEQGSIVKPFVLEAPSAVVATFSGEDSLDHDAVRRQSFAYAPSLKDSDVPTYLLDSTFRI
jgi:hypothetical protein